MKRQVGQTSEGRAMIPSGEFGFDKTVTQQDINLYAEASGDHNPIHIDPDFAAGTPFGGTVAHGMLTLAYMGEMMAATFGQAWLDSGEFRVRFKTPARPGDVLFVRGKVRSVEQREGYRVARCDLSCRNQKGEDVILGDADVRLSPEFGA